MGLVCSSSPALFIDLPFDEALTQFARTDPKEVAELVTVAKQKAAKKQASDGPKSPKKAAKPKA